MYSTRQLDLGRFGGQVQERGPHLVGGGTWKRYHQVVHGWILSQRQSTQHQWCRVDVLQHCPSATRGKMKALKGNFWEKSISANSYRAEQLGVCAIHHLIVGPHWPRGRMSVASRAGTVFESLAREIKHFSLPESRLVHFERL